MSKLLARAAALQRGALLELYDATRAKVYATACAMVGADHAADITRKMYRELWRSLPDANIVSEQAFEQLAVKLTLTHCRQFLQQKESKAFRLPEGRQFVLRPAPTVPADATDAVALIAALPALHRMILVGHTVAALPDAALAEVVRLDVRTLAVARDAEVINVEAMLRTSAKAPVAGYDALIKELSAFAPAVPDAAEAAVIADIKALVAPKEKETRKKVLTRVGIIVGSCAAVIALCLVGLWDMTKPDTETETTSDDATDTSATDPVTEEESEALSLTYTTDYTATHVAEIAIADYGTVTVELDADMAPETVENFKALADSGFYDGLTFHRIMDGFMMQGGDPNGNGTGGSEQNVKGEFAQNGVENTLTHTRGAISMARSSDYNSGSSQFFIVHEDSTFLDGQYAAFGYVTDGMDIVDTICTSAQPTDDNGTIPTEEQPTITSVTVTAL